MRLPLLSLFASFVVGFSAPLALYAQAPALPAGQAHFAIVTANDGKTVGSAEYLVTATAAGYEIASQGDMKVGSFSYSFTNKNRMDRQLNIVRDELTGTVKGVPVTFSLSSDSTGRQFLVNIAASGKNTQNSFDRHQHAVLVPDLDPAAYVEMAHFAVEHPATAWVVIPKENGLLVPAEYDPQPDIDGKFHGQPITIHHVSVIISSQNAISVEVYYTSEGNLLEADLPEQNFYVVRDDFRLDNRPQYAPPRNSAPPQGQQPYPQGQPYPQQPYPQQEQPPQYSVPQGTQPQALMQSY